MPAAPLYAHRLEEAIEVLRSMDTDWIDRRGFEEILAMSKWTAWRLLKACGAENGPGGALAIRRTDLIARLEALREDGRLAREISRRGRLEANLDSMVRMARGKRKEVARDEGARELISTRFASLPRASNSRLPRCASSSSGPGTSSRSSGPSSMPCTTTSNASPSSSRGNKRRAEPL